jgi:hypothetical protein
MLTEATEFVVREQPLAGDAWLPPSAAAEAANCAAN